MKMIEKLAREITDQEFNRTGGVLDDPYYNGMEDGFKAGFRKAREMALKVAETDAYGEIYEAIYKLGEEEV